MPYALFEKEAKLSRAFPTATDVWRCAGLRPRCRRRRRQARLEDDYSIKPCARTRARRGTGLGLEPAKT